jgi:hypothetical protein
MTSRTLSPLQKILSRTFRGVTTQPVEAFPGGSTILSQWIRRRVRPPEAIEPSQAS